MTRKPEFQSSRSEENPWRREAHYARVMHALDIIDITPGVVARQPPMPERRANRRAQLPELIAHQVERQMFQSSRSEDVKPKVPRNLLVVKHGRIEREALEAANAALHPLERSWWTRAARWLRGVFGRA